MDTSKQLLERIYNHEMPSVYRAKDVETDYQLKRFLSLLLDGGVFKSYEEISGLLNLIDFDKIPLKFLPYLASSLGFPFPYDLDEQTQRTFVKNAVASYKIKGTKKALEFMIRELTRFKTEVVIDEINRTVDVRLEVDLDRQDFELVVNKVDFLVKEYAPPYRGYQLINTFLWQESYGKDNMVEGIESITIFAPLTDLDYEVNTPNHSGFFVSNSDYSLSNSESVSYFGEAYYVSEYEEESNNRLVLLDDENLISLFSYEEDLLLWTDDTEINTIPISELDVKNNVIAPLDMNYESKEYFGANNNLTNEIPTYSGETYSANIGEEITEIIRFV